MFRYRKLHRYYAVILILLLAMVWFSDEPGTPIPKKIAGLVGLIVVWLTFIAVFTFSRKLMLRFTDGRFRGSLGPHVFEIGEDSFVESNSEGRKESTLAGLKRVAETNSHFFVLSKTGAGYVIPKRDLENYDALYKLQQKVLAGGA
jgi:hypothetical protein